MLPIYENDPKIKKNENKNEVNIVYNKNLKNIFENSYSKNAKRKVKKLNERRGKLKIIKYLKLYINKTTKQRIIINFVVLLLFLLIIYISYKSTDNLKTVLLITLTLYSLYFLLYSLYILSTILNDEYETYNTIKKDDMISNIFIENELSIINNSKSKITNSKLSNRQNNNINNGYNLNNDRLKDNTFQNTENEYVNTSLPSFQVHNFHYERSTKNNNNINEIELSTKNYTKGTNEMALPFYKEEKTNTHKGEVSNKVLNDTNMVNNNWNNLLENNQKANINLMNNQHDDNETLNNEMATSEGYEIASFESIAKPIKEGSEGFFAVQYNSILKISIIFTVFILLLYVIRGDYTKFPEENKISDDLNDSSIIISPLSYGIITAISFLLGAICSSIAGYNGIYVAVRANIKVAKAATYSYNKALVTCFRSGAVSAIVNVALAIFGICSLLLLVNFMYPTLSFSKYPLLIVGYGFGASLVAMLYQLAGGIYTKAADIGADLVGKIEKHIPEDDARNPAVIADLVGDNVGDCAGQCADLFESISAEIIASMILGGTLSEQGVISENNASYFVLFPLFVHSMDLLISTIGVYLVYVNNGSYQANQQYTKKKKEKKEENYFNNINSSIYLESTVTLNSTNKERDMINENYGHNITSENLENPLKAMLKAYFFTCLLGVTGFSFLCKMLFSSDKQGYEWIYFSLCGVIGMICSYLFVILTRYYTDYSYPKVKKIAHASLSGPATNIIAGLYVGLESTFFPIIVISISLLLSYYLGLKSNITSDNSIINGLYGTSVATMGMLSTAVFILSMSNFGPIADNAGGIVEMSKQPECVRVITDKLDAVGNVTKANTKGFSVGSAALACFLLFSAFLSEVSTHSKIPFSTVDIAIPEVFIGGILGSVVVFLFAGWSLDAVGKTAEEVLKEVRRQFNDHPGILTYQEKPDYHKCVAIISRRALIETIKPGLLGIFSPLIVGLVFKYLGILQNNQLLGAQVIASFIMFSTSTGILMALFLNNAGGAWDNAKKYIESGFYGGKNSPAHVSSVIGDTVGDPCKDTAGPSIHVLIKLISTITMVITPILASTTGK
ncbi:V-type K+-independent H+-translocating inorganic pyrophosphatase, putative [Plasmodium gallinaceum]|uniref:H(+)-exporting diphosphatase n=1 Tax=Plasmodium gallinaceum TaxID=5849 RepID=A0A1J1H138_PLAGA|nr:V-type K+-independent H+-translocating inorganic pyrophosphatase, putative [Plasmodium gallinaceum]CRG96989.1 V-type K+-independent H+-translocating inorganic pyrophosphatase, putative [Plasmodium gallinaceum]